MCASCGNWALCGQPYALLTVGSIILAEVVESHQKRKQTSVGSAVKSEKNRGGSGTKEKHCSSELTDCLAQRSVAFAYAQMLASILSPSNTGAGAGANMAAGTACGGMRQLTSRSAGLCSHFHKISSHALSL